jgi:hypothetical protein
VEQAYGHRTLTPPRRRPLDRAAAHVPHGKHAGTAGLEHGGRGRVVAHARPVSTYPGSSSATVFTSQPVHGRADETNSTVVGIRFWSPVTVLRVTTAPNLPSSPANSATSVERSTRRWTTARSDRRDTGTCRGSGRRAGWSAAPSGAPGQEHCGLAGKVAAAHDGHPAEPVGRSEPGVTEVDNRILVQRESDTARADPARPSTLNR